MTPSDLRERVARAICKAEGDDPDSFDPWMEPEHQHPAWEHYEDHADAAIAIVLEEAAAVAAINWLPGYKITSEFQAGVVSGRLDAAAAIRALKDT
jgi:hypothetical protein